MRNAFAVIHTWPDLKNAEYEVLQRILAAARAIEAHVAVVDNSAKVLWASPELLLTTGQALPANSVDFVLALHFESPRVIDAYSYITLWQPIEFYHQFGYQGSIDKLCTHNDLLSCASDVADAHGLNLMAGLGRAPLMPLPRMFHSLPEPFLEPRITDAARIFYVGINWERVGRPKGRYHELLMALDQKGYLDIYGPEKLFDVAPWEGFESYRGELPFDGESIKYAINRSGVCLALSSVPHKNAGIMSNRLFEGLAGGAAIVATPNALIDKYFGDIVYQVDDSRGEDVLGQQISAALGRIRDDPEEARRRVLEGQRIMREVCSLEGSLADLLATTPARIAQHERQFLTDARVAVILTVRGDAHRDVQARIAELAAQKRCEVELHILCDALFARRNGADLAASATGSIVSVEVHGVRFQSRPGTFDGPFPPRARSGPTIARILETVQSPCFALLNVEDAVFSDHFASLAKALEDDPRAQVACSGMIVQRTGVDGSQTRALDSARFVRTDAVVLVEEVGQSGRFLFRSEPLRAAPPHLLELLDGEEAAYFRLAALLAGPLVQTNYSTYLLDEQAREIGYAPLEPIEHQRQYIRDLFARDPRWLDRLARGNAMPQFVYANGPHTPIRWEDHSVPATVARRLAPNRRVATGVDGEGTRFLTAGFSPPEPALSWISAERGVIEFSLAPSETSQFEDYEISIEAAGRRSLATGREQHCTIALNGMVIAYERVTERGSDLRIAVPSRLTSGARSFRLEIVPDHADMVYDESGAVVDDRRLSIQVMSFGVLSKMHYRVPSFGAGEVHPCGLGGRGAEALFRGFYPPEQDFSWMAGRAG